MSRTEQDARRPAGRRVVIIGGGFGGAYCAQALQRTRSSPPIETILIDRSNYLLFYPLLVEAGTGSLEPRHVVVPIRAFLRSATFRMADVQGVDLRRREVTCRSRVTGEETTVPYDHLVLAPGSVTRLQEVPGLREHGREMKSLADAVALRDRTVELLEEADAEPDTGRRRALLHFVVVGANFTGVEVAGEYEAFLRRAVRRYPNLRTGDVRITLVERDERILPALDADLAEYARRHLERRGVRVRLNTEVASMRATEVTLTGGERLPACTVIWCAGIAPPPLVGRLDVPRDARGYVLCAPDLRVRGHDDVWAIGDAAVNPDPNGRAYPATAQHAVRQGEHLASNLVRALAGRPTRPLAFRTLGSLASLGCRSGVARVWGIKLSGFAAWWLYRTVYLLKMPGLPRKARLALDWTFDLLFPPDIVQLGVHREPDRTAGAGPPAAKSS